LRQGDCLQCQLKPRSSLFWGIWREPHGSSPGSFTTLQAMDALGSSPLAVRAAIRRLKKKGHLASPLRGFQVIVPPEYRGLGCLPAEQFVPDLMNHLGEPYYVGLLSAAAYHGAAHQRPQSLQGIVDNSRRPIRCGEVGIDFIKRLEMTETTIAERNTMRGVLRVATREAKD